VIGLLQRVSRARVDVAGETLGEIERGLLVLVGVERADDAGRAARLLERLLGYRVFPDTQGRMNVSLRGIGGGLLLVPQFTLAADTRKGTRAGFSTAATPELGRTLYDLLVRMAREQHAPVASGQFGADMRVSLVNDGPVTFWLQA
jgi:D-tyrosyl-tRNA(Tyr) deacylase